MNNHNEIPILTYLIVFIVGFVGAVLNFFRRELKGTSAAKKIVFFFVDILSSGLLAVLGFYAATGMGLNELLSIAISGIFAHQGTRAIYLIELIICERLGADKTFKIMAKNKKDR